MVVHSISKDLSFDYLRVCLKSLDYSKIITGAAQPQITRQMLSPTAIPVPPMAVQEQIVAELDKINEVIADNRELLKQLNALQQSIFYDTFGDPVTNPKGWETNKLGNIFKIETGATPRRENESYFKGSIPWVKTTEVQNCLITSTEEHITKEAIDNSNCKIFPLDTILVAMYGQGKTRGQIARLAIEACTNQACAAILPNKKVIATLVLYNFLLNSYEYMRGLAVGCNQKNLNLALIRDISIYIPPLSLQEEFANKIEAIEAQKATIESNIKELQTLLDSRMDYWFN
jgi:type I restriction enzyme S subunit